MSIALNIFYLIKRLFSYYLTCSHYSFLILNALGQINAKLITILFFTKNLLSLPHCFLSLLIIFCRSIKQRILKNLNEKEKANKHEHRQIN